jgi:uncharacterized coiled-coil protein SlyX
MNAALATVIVGVLSFLGTAIGSFGGIKLMTYRIEQLEKKVEKHNSIIERTFKLEEKTELQEEKIKVINHRLEDGEKLIEKLREKP